VNARVQGQRLREALDTVRGRGSVLEVRGRGLLTGIELSAPAAHGVVLAMLEEGVLATEAGVNVVRLSPPLVAGGEHVDAAVAAFSAAVERVPELAGARA